MLARDTRWLREPTSRIINGMERTFKVIKVIKVLTRKRVSILIDVQAP
jgi:hypothetical protein